MDLSILIVNWNTREYLCRCLAAVRAQPTALAHEVIVVDNASSDGSAAMVRGLFPQARLIENEENVGFARGNNQAFRLCQGRYILLLNPDAEVFQGALDTLVSFMEAHPRAGAAGARLLSPSGVLQPSCHPAPTLARESWRLFHLDAIYPLARYPMHRWDLDTPREVEVIQGACLLLRRQALEQVDGLDEEYFMYSEEVDLCRRLRRAGWQLFWVPQARVAHYGGQSTRQVPDAMFLHLYRSKVLYFRKHHNQAAAAVYKAILFVAALARLLCSPLTSLATPSRRSARLAMAGRYRRLIAALPGM